jgi:hypothetical protein
MAEVPAVTVLKHVWEHAPAAGTGRPSPSSAWNFESVEAVEIIAPDRYCATLLVDCAAPSWPAEIIPGSAWIVRFQPPPAGGAWVVELFSLIERWLESVPLPCAKVLHDGRNYLFRASTGLTSQQREATAGS